MTSTPLDRLPGLVSAQRRFFATGATRPLAFRREQLGKLLGLVRESEPEIERALGEDLGKPAFESYVSEIGFCRSEIQHALDNLEDWIEPEPVPGSLLLFPAKSTVEREPRGHVLVLAPWNYPFQLVVSPLLGALAAGNCALLKPSEWAPHTAALISRLVAERFAPEVVAVATGGPDVAEALLRERFDHVFFTGSARVGKIVMKAAAEHLTPVTLELGGKSPAIVAEDARLEVAARRIAWGKFLNAGQTCIAPDYLLVPASRKDEIVAAIDRNLRKFYGEEPKNSPDYARIVSEHHFERLASMLAEGRVLLGGEADREARYIAPTLIADLPEDAALLQEEIFGPILPVVSYETLDEAIAIARRHPDPLALYAFSSRKETLERLRREVPSGGAAMNDTLVHFSNLNLPFGGRGASGVGRYHGRYSFEIFSHHRAVFHGFTRLDPPLRYPPYAGKLRWMKKLIG